MAGTSNVRAGWLLVALVLFLAATSCGDKGVNQQTDVEQVGTQAQALTPAQLPVRFIGPVLQPEIITLFWGNMSAADITGMKSYLTSLTDSYMTGGTSPAGKEPVLFQYGVYGARVIASVTDTVLPASGHAVLADFKARIASWQSLGYLPPYSPVRVFLVFTQGFAVDDEPGLSDHGEFESGHYYARVPFERKLSGKTATMSHQMGASRVIFETATDPKFRWGWADAGAFGAGISFPCGTDFTSESFGLVQHVVDKLQMTCGIYGRQRLPQTSAVSWASNRVDLFSLGANREILHKAWTGINWLPSYNTWESLGGQAILPPTAISVTANSLDLFVVGTDRALYHKAWRTTAWQPPGAGWDYLGGIVNGPISVISMSAASLEVFVQGTDGAYYHKKLDGQAWLPSQTGWDSLGGVFIGPPAAFSNIDQEMWVVGQGLDTQYYANGYRFSAFAGWGVIAPEREDDDPIVTGDILVGPPFVASASPRSADVFGLAQDGSIRHTTYKLGFSRQWDNLGGNFMGYPQAVAWGMDRVDVFGQGTDSVYYRRNFDGFGWQPYNAWEAHGANFLSSPAVSIWPNDFEVFGRGSNGELYGQSYNTVNGWAPAVNDWSSLGGAIH